MDKVWKNISVMLELTFHLFVLKFLTIYSSEIMCEDAFVHESTCQSKSLAVSPDYSCYKTKVTLSGSN